MRERAAKTGRRDGVADGVSAQLHNPTPSANIHH